jgi:hypothetical protein
MDLQRINLNHPTLKGDVLQFNNTLCSKKDVGSMYK